MQKWKLMATSAAIALCGSGAQAVTPEEVWDNWKSMMEGYGQTITTDAEGRDGDALVIENLTITQAQDKTLVEMVIPELRFTESGDDTVAVTLSDSYDMVVTPDSDKADTTVTVTIAHPGLSIVASGDAAETRYDFDGPEMTIDLAELAGEAAEAEVSAGMRITNLAGNYILSGGDKRALSSNFTAEALDASIDATGEGPDGQGTSKVHMEFALADLGGQSNAVLTGDMADMAQAIRDGFSTDGSVTHGAASLVMDVEDPQGPVHLVSDTASGSLSFTMGQSGLGYGVTAQTVSMTMSGAQIPFPELKLTASESAFDFLMPVAVSEAPSDFRLVTKLVDLVVPDEIWAMLDPTGQLPRDPATLLVDTSGKARMTADIFDPKAAETMTAAPGELNELTLNALQLKLAGAEVTGNGALTFDNKDMVTYGGMPAPTGSVNFKATGVNALLDTLSAMGLIPEDELMGYRMMMGMFVKIDPSAPDTMTSELKFEGQHFFVNGMQLQ